MLLQFFPTTTVRDDGPVWSTGVSKARGMCKITGKGNVVIPIAPLIVTSQPGKETTWRWAVDLPCPSLNASH